MSADLRRQIERGRDVIETRREDEQLAQQQRRKFMTTTRKTAYGDRVSKWPSTEPVFSLVEEVDRAMRDLFKEAQDRRDADETMRQQSHPNESRFPALGGQ
jgi:hypothetical protein